MKRGESGVDGVTSERVMCMVGSIVLGCAKGASEGIIAEKGAGTDLLKGIDMQKTSPLAFPNRARRLYYTPFGPKERPGERKSNSRFNVHTAK